MDLSYVEKRRFVWARLKGPWTIEEVCSKPASILAECLARKQDLLLIDFRELQLLPVSTLDRYKLGASIISFSGKLRRIAAVATPGFIDPEKLGERVARNRGVNVRVFAELDKAQRWLLEDQPPADPS